MRKLRRKPEFFCRIHIGKINWTLNKEYGIYLHHRAGTQNPVEIHGNLDWVYCPNCRSREPFTIIEQQINCPSCRHILEPNVVLYGDELKEFPRAIDLMDNADILLVIGTSFSPEFLGENAG
jgi:hypothetical protein